MTKQDYLELLVETIHSTTIATIGADGHPQTRVIDMMLYDEQGVYFLTAKGKAFYAQLCPPPRTSSRSPCEGRSKASAAKSWTRSSRKTPICSPSIPAIPAVLWKCSACMKPRESTSISAIHLTLHEMPLRSVLQNPRSQAIMLARAALAASCAILSARRNASTLRKSLWSSTSTGVSTADGVRKSVPSRLSKRGFDHEPK